MRAYVVAEQPVAQKQQPVVVVVVVVKVLEEEELQALVGFAVLAPASPLIDWLTHHSKQQVERPIQEELMAWM